MTAALNGTKPDIKRDAFDVYGDVGEDTKMGVLKKEDSPGEWIESGPHSNVDAERSSNAEEEFHADFSKGEPYVMMPGTDYAHLMIPLPWLLSISTGVQAKQVNLYLLKERWAEAKNEDNLC